MSVSQYVNRNLNTGASYCSLMNRVCQREDRESLYSSMRLGGEGKSRVGSKFHNLHLLGMNDQTK